MVEILIAISALLVGSSLGYMYGYSFALQQRSIFFSSIKKQRARVVCLFAFRFFLIYVAVRYLLHSPSLPSILMLTSFVVTFWLYILKKKAYQDERA